MNTERLNGRLRIQIDKDGVSIFQITKRIRDCTELQLDSSEVARIKKNDDPDETIIKLLEALVSIKVLEQAEYTVKRVEYDIQNWRRT
jgi:intein-encoded DNA endonuclease-like protein